MKALLPFIITIIISSRGAPLQVAYPFPEPAAELRAFRVSPTFCDLHAADPLFLHDQRHSTSKMRLHGGPACKYLPFHEFNHSKMKVSLIYRHLPKGGSSTIGQLLDEAWNDIWSHEKSQNKPSPKTKQMLQRVLNCHDPRLDAARQAGRAVEFAVAREPLSRFVSVGPSINQSINQ